MSFFSRIEVQGVAKVYVFSCSMCVSISFCSVVHGIPSRNTRDELDGVHEYLIKQVEVLDKALDDDLGDYEKRVEEIEDECKEKIDNLQEDLAQSI
eukprot:8759851-Karenia_brevis.AAC.1